VRAKEHIVEIYRQRSELIEAGLTPVRVVVSPGHYKVLQAYRGRLGDLDGPVIDYLDPYRVFDLEICVEDIETPVVQCPDGEGDGVRTE